MTDYRGFEIEEDPDGGWWAHRGAGLYLGPFNTDAEAMIAIDAVLDENELPAPRRLTRQERLEGLADSGCDTWEEYRSER